jgi:hypothetical protein
MQRVCLNSIWEIAVSCGSEPTSRDSPMKPLVQLANWWCRFLCLLAMAGSRGHLTMAHLCVSRLSQQLAGGRPLSNCCCGVDSLSLVLRLRHRPHTGVRTLRSPAALGEQRQNTRGREIREAPAAVQPAGFSSARCGYLQNRYTFANSAEWRQNQDHVGGRGPKRCPEIFEILTLLQ